MRYHRPQAPRSAVPQEVSQVPGPIPLRSEERRRSNGPDAEPIKTSVEDIQAANLPFPIELSPRPPEPDEISAKWHPMAQELWDAVCRSPEAMWQTSAGWAVLRLMCEQLSRQLKPQVVGIVQGGWQTDEESGERVWVDGGPIIETVPMKGADLAAHHRVWAAMGLLEGDRRRMQREVTLHPAMPTQSDLPAGVDSIAKNRSSLLTPRTEEP